MITLEDMVRRNQELLLDIQEDVRKLLVSQANPKPEMISGGEAAEIMQMTYNQFMNFWKNKFPHSKVGRKVFFDRKVIEAYVRDRDSKIMPVEYRQAATV